MKNNNKKFILIPLLSSLVILLSACSIIVSDHNDSKPEIRTTISNQGFNKLAVSVAISDISVKYGDKYKVEYAGPKNLKPIVNRKNGVLTIKQSASGVHHVNSDLTIAITVPKQLLKNVTLSTNDGDIEADFEQKSLAQCHKIQHETDKEAKKYSGDELQDKLNEANQKMADTVYDNTVELLGNMVNEGHGLMTLKYDLLD